MGDVELADGLLQASVVLIGGQQLGPGAVRICQKLGEHIRRLKRDPARVTFLQFDEAGVIR